MANINQFGNEELEMEHRAKSGTVFCINRRIKGEFVDNNGSPRNRKIY